MIGHQEAATRITALKSTLWQEGEEMEEVNEPPKVNNPALEEAGDTAVAVTENGTNNGDA